MYKGKNRSGDVIKKYKRFSLLLFLSAFLSITLFINYFHTEDGIISKTDDCPACHFLNSSYTTSQIHFFHLPPPAAAGLLENIYFFTYTQNTFIIPLSRSPPAV